MQISGVNMTGGYQIVPPTLQYPPGPVSGDPTLSLGTTVDWTSNTFLYIAEGQSNVTAQDYRSDTNNMVWQLFYAHRSIRLPVGSGNPGFRFSTITRQGGTNTIGLNGVASSSNNTKGNFNSNVETIISTFRSFQYTANTLYQGNVQQQFTVPANRYFLLGFTGGPFYKNYRRTANNYTAVYLGNAIVTAIPEVYSAPWPTGPVRGIPSQLGGNTSSYLKFESNILLSAIRFEVV